MIEALVLLIAAPVDYSEYLRAAKLADQVIYNPSSYFEGDFEHDILTGRFLGRDGQHPQYALAVRYGDCIADSAGTCTNQLVFRLVRSKPIRKESPWPGAIIQMATEKVRTPADVRRFAQGSDSFQWLEADSVSCPNAFEKVEAVRKSHWTPPLDHRLSPEDDEFWTHVPTYEVSMANIYAKMTYRGPPYDNLPSGALIQLMETLEPCWKPSKAKKPWSR